MPDREIVRGVTSGGGCFEKGEAGDGKGDEILLVLLRKASRSARGDIKRINECLLNELYETLQLA